MTDISLAVGDGARRMTYAELAAVRGTSQPSAERLVRRRRWPRQVGNDGVVRVLVPLTEAREASKTAGVALAPDMGPPNSGLAPDNREVAPAGPGQLAPDKTAVAPAPVEAGPGQLAPAGPAHVRGLESAIEVLQEQLAVANAALIAERQRVDELLRQLADAPERGAGADPITAIGMQTLSQAVEMLREDVERERDRADRAERQGEVERQEGHKRVDGLLIELADARTAAMITGCEAAALRSRLAFLTERRPWWRRWFR